MRILLYSCVFRSYSRCY